MIFAAIDIGSNAMRLLFCRVYEVDGKPHFSKEELIRMPIRLGEDVFTKGIISQAKEDRLITSLKGFHELIKAFDVDGYRAVATSAMRDASNGAEIIIRAKKVRIPSTCCQWGRMAGKERTMTSAIGSDLPHESNSAGIPSNGKWNYARL